MRWTLLLCWALYAGTSAAATSGPDPFRFALQTSAGGGADVFNPGVLVGFNPQPDPPGEPAFVDLGNAFLPAVQTGTAGGHSFSFVFALGDPPQTNLTWSFVAGTPTGADTVAFDVLLGGVVAYHVTGQATSSDGARLDPGSLVGFNPQPDPPGFQSIGFNFSFAVPTATALPAAATAPFARMAFQMTDANGNAIAFSAAPVPEPASAVLLAAGLAVLLGGRRLQKKARAISGASTEASTACMPSAMPA